MPYRNLLPIWLFLILTVGLTAYAAWGTPNVPFHPDESTQLFMSSDFDLLLQNPFSLIWSPEKRDDLRQHYREIDAPITRYILGVGRSLAGLSALENDWDWSKSWEENRQAGALPDEKLLRVGRFSMLLLFPLCLLLIYLVSKSIGNATCGLFAVSFLGMHALILLHNRRSMAEAALTFGLLFALWSFLEGDHHPWLAGIGMALAFNAKQSILALLPIGLLSVGWFPRSTPKRVGKIIWAVGQYLSIFVLITMVSNPFLWRYPIQALQASWNSRQALLANQLTDTLRLAPEQALLSPSKRVAAMLYNLFLAPPSFAEASNYQEQTTASEEAYLDNPGNNLLRNLVGGGIMLTMTFFGLVSAILQILRTKFDQNRAMTLILLATMIQAAALLILVPLPWQRYVIPLVPFVCIWVAYGVSLMVKVLCGIRCRTRRSST